MNEYSLTSGPLSSFDFLFDPHLQKIKDWPTLSISAKAIPDSKFADYRRNAKSESLFLTELVKSLQGKWIVGMVDASNMHAKALEMAIRKSPLESSEIKFGVAEDDLVLFAPQEPKDLAYLWPHYPPSAGETFFYLTTQILDVVEVYWQRKATSKQDHFRRDVLEFGANAKLTILVDEEGSFHLVAAPGTDDGLQDRVVEAGLAGGMRITSAPSLFG